MQLYATASWSILLTFLLRFAMDAKKSDQSCSMPAGSPAKEPLPGKEYTYHNFDFHFLDFRSPKEKERLRQNQLYFYQKHCHMLADARKNENRERHGCKEAKPFHPCRITSKGATASQQGQWGASDWFRCHPFQWKSDHSTFQLFFAVGSFWREKHEQIHEWFDRDSKHDSEGIEADCRIIEKEMKHDWEGI